MYATCRDEMLDVIIKLVKKKRCNEFTMAEVLDAMAENHTIYKESTIKTHLTAKCCKGTPVNHATKYDDYEKIDRGVYRLVDYSK